jgi:hypothetical protein
MFDKTFECQYQRLIEFKKKKKNVLDYNMETDNPLFPLQQSQENFNICSAINI